MTMPKNEMPAEIQNVWNTYMQSFEKSVTLLEEHIRKAGEMAEMCTGEWCTATEHVLDDLNNALFSISEPRWTDPEDSEKLKEFKQRLRILYTNFQDITRKADQ